MERLDILAREANEQIYAEVASAQLDKYFKGGKWGRNLDLLQHLCQYNDQPILVTGEHGSGKTTLMQALLEDEDKVGNFRWCSLTAQAAWDAHVILQQIADGFNVAWQQDITFDVEDLIAAANVDSKIWLLLIDDAQLLSTTALQLLLSLANSALPAQSSKATLAAVARRKIHLVLLGTPETTVKLAVAGGQQLIKNELQVIELEPLLPEEIGGYLQHKWQLVGKQITFPFNQKMIKRIYRLAQGNPQKIEQFAADALAGKKLQHTEEGIILDMSKAPVFLGITIFAGLVGWLVFSTYTPISTNNRSTEVKAITSTANTNVATYSRSLNHTATAVVPINVVSATADAQPLNISPQSDAAGSANAMPQSSSASEADIAASSTTAIDANQSMSAVKLKLAELREAVAVARQREKEANITADNASTSANANTSEAKVKVKVKAENTNRQLTETLNAAIAEQEQLIAQTAADMPEAYAAAELSLDAEVDRAPTENVTETVDAPVHKSSTVAENSVIKVATKAVANSVKPAAAVKVERNTTEKTILALPSKHYTLQLLGANKLEGIEQVIKEYDLANEVYYYRTKRNGHDWYVMVYGNYASYAAAKKALQSLPQHVQRMLQTQRAKPWTRSISAVHKDLLNRRS